MKRFASKPRQYFPLRWKLLIYFFVFLLIATFGGIYVNLGAKTSTRLFGAILAENQQLEDLGSRISRLRYFVEKYLAESNYASLEEFFRSDVELREVLERLDSFIPLIGEEEKRYLYLDLRNSIESVIDLAERAVDARRSGQGEISYQMAQRLNRAADVTHKFTVSLMNRNTVLGNRQYESIVAKTKRIELFSYLLALAIAVLGVVFVLQFSFGITQPLKQIIDNAQMLAAGEFQVGEIKVDSNDELEIIAGVFNRMARSIRELFEKTEEKMLLERELKQEKMRNLEITSLLREAELKALQAQVNPHFLYNTLNAISQVAILEGAAETGELTKSVAALLRYNLRRLDQPVTIDDEIGNVRQYLHIMQVRYGDQLEYHLSSSLEVGGCLIPCMTIQPLVENAIIHGIARSGRKGELTVSVTSAGDGEHLVIRIADNGVGMDSKFIQKVLAREESQPEDQPDSAGQTTGLGLRNITNRLRFFYGQDDVVRIASKPGEGTVVELFLPIVTEEREFDRSTERAQGGIL